MARTPDNFSLNNQLSTTAEILHTPSASGESAIIRKLSFYNSNTTTARQVTVYIVQTSGSAATTNTMAVKTIPPLKTWNCLEAQGEVLEFGVSLQVDVDAGTDVNANMAGTTVT